MQDPEDAKLDYLELSQPTHQETIRKPTSSDLKKYCRMFDMADIL